MRSADAWFEAYGASHKNPTNKVIHWICVPLIVFATLGLLWAIPLPFVDALLPPEWAAFANLGSVTILGLIFGFYLRLSVTITVAMAAFTAACVQGILALERIETPMWQVCAAIFIVAWIGQFIGHHIEGQKPSFLEDLQFLFVGPAWLIHFIYKKLGIPY